MPMPFSPAGQALGLNSLPGLGTALADQSAESAEELRKRKMLEASSVACWAPAAVRRRRVCLVRR
jgi:hypothetical protein